MTDPFKIDGPICINFSGGRTSAYMLWRFLSANGGLPDEAQVCFANTGKEDEETLKFVDACSRNWGVKINWIEYWPHDCGYSIKDFQSASRKGEPFATMIDQNGKPYLPNPVKRICTINLKIKPVEKFMKQLGDDEFLSVVGIRADEPIRIAQYGYDRCPMAKVGISKRDVWKFWRLQSFDLGLPVINGGTPHGNCDLCFLKGPNQLLSLIAEKPARAVWWIEQEKHANGTFRSDRPSYAAMLQNTKDQIDAFGYDEDSTMNCFCGD